MIQVSQTRLLKIKQHYTPFLITKLPLGAVFVAKKDDMTITGYQSGKIMFQGVSSEQEANKWRVTETSSSAIKPAKKMVLKLPDGFSHQNVIGSDEVGTGDFFGPITVCAAYVNREAIPLLTSLGVRDSKTMKDPEICAIAEKIIPLIPHSSLLCPNEKYNKLIGSGMNQGQMKALLHNQAISHVLKKIAPQKPEAILIDQFAERNTYYRYLKKAPQVITENVYFATKAEGLHLAVAAASIIARYHFVKHFAIMEDELGIPLVKGAGAKVDQIAAQILKKNGKDALNKYTKKHFANTEKACLIAKKTRDN